jgi:2-polyprenyl-3-methyl-5-hydroxy-6-metoxy-1,4-benzoquinol methylase
VPGRFDEAYWEERYRSHPEGARGRRPSPQLVTEAGDLTPGTALDAGCGEGADAVWLAVRGWRVTAVDIAPTALRRAQAHAEALDVEVASRIDWVQADLTGWTPTQEHFDLVSAHYVHPAGSHEALVRRLASSVAPGGTLLVVGHRPSHRHGSGSHAPPPETHVTADEIAATLEPDRWDIAVAAARGRDAVLRARRRP